VINAVFLQQITIKEIKNLLLYYWNMIFDWNVPFKVKANMGNSLIMFLSVRKDGNYFSYLELNFIFERGLKAIINLFQKYH